VIFVDASAMVALLCREEAMEEIASVIDHGAPLVTSPFAMIEAALAIVHRKDHSPCYAGEEVKNLIERTHMAVVPITPSHFDIALEAFERFGKGRHKARLNMGDCFAYAVARSHAAAILFVGDDFVHTDLKNALDPS
jgi:ribonuclease VapC